MDIIFQLFQALLHIDQVLFHLVDVYGALTYLILFLIIFCETGLIITPFLPGDSLLFAAGSLAANTSNQFNIQILFLLLSIASMLGNKVNYLAGRFIGPKIFSAKDAWFWNKKHLIEAHDFYQKHGGKAIILARFLPIIRTFAPFVAGIGGMNLRLFTFYNILSALLWVGSLLGAGYFLGSQSFVKAHFTTIIYAIITLSLLPPLFSFSYHKFFARSS